MLGWTRRRQHDRDKHGGSRRIAAVLALVSAGGTLASLILWLEVGVVGAALAFAATIAVLYGSISFLTRGALPKRAPDAQSLDGRAATEPTKRAIPPPR
jgi:hypothetical protein